MYPHPSYFYTSNQKIAIYIFYSLTASQETLQIFALVEHTNYIMIYTISPPVFILPYNTKRGGGCKIKCVSSSKTFYL